MQPLDPHTLFSIFEQGDEEIYQEHGITDVLNNPYVLMGMVVRGMENYHMIDMVYNKRYPDEYKAIKGTIKSKYYNKLYGYLTRMDYSKFETIYSIGNSFDINEVHTSLFELLKYFEQKEEYEKCQIVKNFFDLLSEEVMKKVVS